MMVGDRAHAGGLTAAVSLRLLREDMRLRAGTMVEMTPKTYIVLGQAGYKISQGWLVATGVEILGGPRGSTFGLFDRNDLIYGQGRYSF